MIHSHFLVTGLSASRPSPKSLKHRTRSNSSLDAGWVAKASWQSFAHSRLCGQTMFRSGEGCGGEICDGLRCRCAGGGVRTVLVRCRTIIENSRIVAWTNRECCMYSPREQGLFILSYCYLRAFCAALDFSSVRVCLPDDRLTAFSLAVARGLGLALSMRSSEERCTQTRRFSR